MPRLKKDIVVKSIGKKLPPVKKINIGCILEHEVVLQPKAVDRLIISNPSG